MLDYSGFCKILDLLNIMHNSSMICLCFVWDRAFCSSWVGTGDVWELEHLLWSSHQQPDTALLQVTPPSPQGFYGSKGQRSSLDLKVSYVSCFTGCKGLESYPKPPIMTIHLRRTNDHCEYLGHFYWPTGERFSRLTNL